MISGREREEGKKSMNFPKVLPTLLCGVSQWYRTQLHCGDTITHFWVHTRLVTLSRLAVGWIRIVLVSLYCHKHEMVFFLHGNFSIMNENHMECVWGEVMTSCDDVECRSCCCFGEEIEAPKNIQWEWKRTKTKTRLTSSNYKNLLRKGRAQHEHCWELFEKASENFVRLVAVATGREFSRFSHFLSRAVAEDVRKRAAAAVELEKTTSQLR